VPPVTLLSASSFQPLIFFSVKINSAWNPLSLVREEPRFQTTISAVVLMYQHRLLKGFFIISTLTDLKNTSPDSVRLSG
jgi:hypothetical protein